MTLIGDADRDRRRRRAIRKVKCHKTYTGKIPVGVLDHVGHGLVSGKDDVACPLDTDVHGAVQPCVQRFAKTGNGIAVRVVAMGAGLGVAGR